MGRTPTRTKAIRLRRVSDAEPGITRIRRGRGFTYRDVRGRQVSARRRERIRELAIPPAWTDVWICTRADGHLQATGFDARGRKQYIYHEQWRALRHRETLDGLATFGDVLPRIRAEVDAQLRRRTVDRNRVLAGMVRFLDLTGIRVGNERYERENRTIGLCTLRWSHIRLENTSATVRFSAKSNIRAELEIADASLLRLLREMRSSASPSARQRVFQADKRPISSRELNGYLESIAGERVTAKEFRTWRGTVTALRTLIEEPAPPTKRGLIRAFDAAAADLRNTRAVARAHYVHPDVTDEYLAGTLPTLAQPEPPLDAYETAVLALLRGSSNRRRQ